MRKRHGPILLVGACLALVHCSNADRASETPNRADAESRGENPALARRDTTGTAPPRAAARGPLFLALDEDENGRIMPEEAQALPRLEDSFSAFDLDGSGGIDVQEYTEARQADFTPNRKSASPP